MKMQWRKLASDRWRCGAYEIAFVLRPKLAIGGKHYIAVKYISPKHITSLGGSKSLDAAKAKCRAHAHKAKLASVFTEVMDEARRNTKGDTAL